MDSTTSQDDGQAEQTALTALIPSEDALRQQSLTQAPFRIRVTYAFDKVFIRHRPGSMSPKTSFIFSDLCCENAVEFELKDGQVRTKTRRSRGREHILKKTPVEKLLEMSFQTIELPNAVLSPEKIIASGLVFEAICQNVGDGWEPATPIPPLPKELLPFGIKGLQQLKEHPQGLSVGDPADTDWEPCQGWNMVQTQISRELLKVTFQPADEATLAFGRQWQLFVDLRDVLLPGWFGDVQDTEQAQPEGDEDSERHREFWQVSLGETRITISLTLGRRSLSGLWHARCTCSTWLLATSEARRDLQPQGRRSCVLCF
jgi:hypothetical protein